MGRLIALDTETTGLDPATCEVWEIGAVDLDTGDEFEWRLRPSDYAVATMHPRAAEVNRFHERTEHPDWRWHDNPKAALAELHGLLDGAHVIGAVPDFDARFLGATYARWSMVPPRWHYHLIDVESVAVGFLAGLRAAFVEVSPWSGEVAWAGSAALAAAEAEWPLPLPWDSDALSAAVGVRSPSGGERHTALGDARWVADMWRRMMSGACGAPLAAVV